MADELQRLLERACPKPERLATNGGAVLSLALHCLMVNAGYRLEDCPARGNEYRPSSGWDSKFKEEWVFCYTWRGKANRFVLHCSLQSQTNRMFVHASETQNESNIQILGLQLDNYVPDPQQLASGSWAGVLQRVDSMVEMVTQYVTEPLAASAEDAPEHDPPSGSTWSDMASSSLQSLTPGHYALVGAAVVVAATVVIYRHCHR